MRPFELTMDGFKSYRDEQSFSFEGRMLFGIVGPTGAGKSSILEAIIFCLYGKTPRVERDTKKLINSTSDVAHVRLVFEVDGVSWEVTRAIRRKGASQVVLKRYGEGAPESTGDRAVNTRIEELLGLDFQAFCSSVVLPQGEFDRFLHATPGDRSKILKGIFRLERVDAIRAASREKSARFDERISALKAELGSLPTDPELIEGLRSSLNEEQARREAINKELDAALKAESSLGKAEDELAQIDERIGEAGGAFDSVPSANTLEKLASDEDEKRNALASAEKQTAEAEERSEGAESVLEEARESTGGDEAIAGAKEMVRTRERLAQQLSTLEAALPNLKKIWQEEAKRAGSLAKEAEGAAEAVEAKRTELDQLRIDHAAHEIRKDLKKGEPCPVCGQSVHELPRAARVPAIAASEKELAASEKRAKEASLQLEEAKRAQALAEERFKSTTNQVAAGRNEIKTAEAEIASLLKIKADPSKEIARRESILRKARAEFDDARKALDLASRNLRTRTKELEEVASILRKHSASLIEICSMLRIPRPDIDGDAAGLLDAAKRAHDAASSIIKTEQRKRLTIEKGVESAARLVGEFRKRFNVSDDVPLATALEDSNAAIGRIQRQIEESELALERSKEIIKETETITTEKLLYDRLSADLTDHRFTAYLLDWERKLLARLGSEKFYELTNSRYRFDDNGDFQIVETVDGTTRTPDTLSGGETFLASLALALALAEAVTLEGGRLGCFFLDEGFGALDNEALNRALTGVESLASPDRMIGLISHVGGIQHELDDLIVLEKSEDGTTNVLQTEGPIAYLAATI